MAFFSLVYGQSIKSEICVKITGLYGVYIYVYILIQGD